MCRLFCGSILPHPPALYPHQPGILILFIHTVQHSTYILHKRVCTLYACPNVLHHYYSYTTRDVTGRFLSFVRCRLITTDKVKYGLAFRTQIINRLRCAKCQMLSNCSVFTFMSKLPKF